MTERKRRVFPVVFEREAVERVRASGMTIVAVADELGLHETVLRRWIARFGGGCDDGSGTAAVRICPNVAVLGRLGGRECAAKARGAPAPDGA